MRFLTSHAQVFFYLNFAIHLFLNIDPSLFLENDFLLYVPPPGCILCSLWSRCSVSIFKTNTKIDFIHGFFTVVVLRCFDEYLSAKKSIEVYEKNTYKHLLNFLIE